MSPMPAPQAQWDYVQLGSLACACVRHSGGCPSGGQPAEALRILEQRSRASQGQLPLSTGDPLLDFHLEETDWSLEVPQQPSHRASPFTARSLLALPRQTDSHLLEWPQRNPGSGGPQDIPRVPHWSSLIREAVIPGCWAHLQQLSLFKRDSAGRDPAWNEAWGGDTGLP